MTDSIVIVDFRSVRRQLTQLRKLAEPSQQRIIIGKLVERVAVTGQSLVSDPPVPSRKPLPAKYPRTSRDGGTYMSKFKTAKQQGFFFAKIVKNNLTPYRRGRGQSEQLTAALGLLPYTIKRQSRHWVITWGLDQTYAELVVGDETKQADYHKGVWTVLEDDIASERAVDTYKQVFVTGLNNVVENLARGSSSPFTI